MFQPYGELDGNHTPLPVILLLILKSSSSSLGVILPGRQRLNRPYSIPYIYEEKNTKRESTPSTCKGLLVKSLWEMDRYTYYFEQTLQRCVVHLSLSSWFGQQVVRSEYTVGNMERMVRYSPASFGPLRRHHRWRESNIGCFLPFVFTLCSVVKHSSLRTPCKTPTYPLSFYSFYSLLGSNDRHLVWDYKISVPITDLVETEGKLGPDRL